MVVYSPHVMLITYYVEFQYGKETVQTTTNKSTPMVEGIRLEK